MVKSNKGKPKWKRALSLLCLVCAVCAGLELLGGLGVYILYWLMGTRTFYTSSEAASIGIIGGADGPTAIFLTTPAWTSYVGAAVLLAVGLLGYLWLGKNRNE